MIYDACFTFGGCAIIIPRL